LSNISNAFRAFFALLGGNLPPDIAQAYGYSKAAHVPRAKEDKAAPVAPPKAEAGPADGAVQILSVLQRDARLVDFLMEDLTGYADEQVGAAVRDVQMQSRDSLQRYMRLTPVIDSIEGEFTKTQDLAPDSLRLIGKVPPSGKAPGGVLRHKGWKAEKVDLPKTQPGSILAPAEIEIE
jgi:Domain of unknown function (DUF2760)